MFSHNKIINGVGIICLLIHSSAFAAKGPSPQTVDGAQTISAQQAKKLWQQGATFVDTRKDSDWEAGRVPGAVHINIKKPEFNKETVLKHVAIDAPVVSYCNAEKCHRAASGAKKLVEFGFSKVYYYRDGFPSWKNAGYPYE
ncbi:MAG: rhodanese-like domain-containing protein [Thiomicrorhabdus sp.]|nr:rhodanese-like domain-containing protein [Thiomicrorhabdus sp.]